MADITFRDILQAVEKLTTQQKAVLAQNLNAPFDTTPSRDELIAEMNTLHSSGAFDNVASLRNAYASPSQTAVTAEQLSEDIRQTSNEWEQELDEFFRNEH